MPACSAAAGRHRPLLLATVALVLLAQGAPVATAIFAGAGHAVYHLSVRMALVHAEHMEHQREGWGRDLVVFEHSHGPGQEVHSHAVPVDVALRMMDSDREHSHDPVVPADQRVDKHVPADSDRHALNPLPGAGAPAQPDRFHPIAGLPPPTPPPQA